MMTKKRVTFSLIVLNEKTGCVDTVLSHGVTKDGAVWTQKLSAAGGPEDEE